MADITNKNPWVVKNLKDFQFYVCPECDVKEKFLETFLQHALNEHDKAKETLPKIIVKAEFEDEENNVSIHAESADDFGYDEQNFYDDEEQQPLSQKRRKTHKKPRSKRRPTSSMPVKKSDDDIKFSYPSELLDVKIKTEERQFMNLAAKFLLSVRYMVVFSIRVVCAVTYFAPFLGLCGLLNHHKAGKFL